MEVPVSYSIQATPETEIIQQQQSFKALLQELEQASSSQIESVLAEREMVQPEEELSSEIITRLQQRIRNASKA